VKRFILTLGLGLVLLTGVPIQAQPGGASDAPEQLVGDWFRRFLGREVSQGAGYWVDLLRQGQAPDAVLAQIVASPEYYLRAGNSPQGFVTRLHQDLTGRPPSGTETNFWVNRLYSSDRQSIAAEMLQRYPQDWNAGYSGGYSSGTYGGRYDRDRYSHDYRRPFRRFYHNP